MRSELAQQRLICQGQKGEKCFHGESRKRQGDSEGLESGWAGQGDIQAYFSATLTKVTTGVSGICFLGNL